MFVVLSEINTLDYLHRHGVYPNEFYTDLNLFKESAVHFKDAIVLVVFAGVTNFRKRNVCAEINHLRDRAKSTVDTGVKGVIVIADTTLPIQNYYMYSRNWNKVSLRSNWVDLQKGIDFFASLKAALGEENVEGTVCDIKYAETIEEAKQRIEENLKAKSHQDEDAYIPKIKVFNVREAILDNNK